MRIVSLYNVLPYRHADWISGREMRLPFEKVCSECDIKQQWRVRLHIYTEGEIKLNKFFINLNMKPESIKFDPEYPHVPLQSSFYILVIGNQVFLHNWFGLFWFGLVWFG